MKINQVLPGLKRKVFLNKYTTFKIGGQARYFFVAKNEKDLIFTLKAAKKFGLPFFILGGGSNVLVSDKGFDGLVVKIQNSGFRIWVKNSDFKIFCESGMSLAHLLFQSLKIGATGLEWAVGIPGTVGGAVYGNAGAFGSSMADIVSAVRVLEIPGFKFPYPKNKTKSFRFFEDFSVLKFKTKILKNKDCQFKYRDSIFKRKKNLIILSAEIKLKKGDKKEILKKIKGYLRQKRENQPLDLPSAGCVFKNPRGFFAGELIEKCGLKGKKIGGVKISEKHANFIVNLGGGKARDVRDLINLAKKRVKNKFGVVLEEEIQLVGF